MSDEVRVVVVDDVPDVAESLAALLQISGYLVEVAFDGAKALELIEHFQPHCILFDVFMPGLDGDQLAQALRSRYRDDVVLIAVTGADVGDNSVKRTFMQADHYLRKPVDLAALQKVLPPVD